MKKLIMIFITAAAFGLVSCSSGSNDDSIFSPYISFKSAEPFTVSAASLSGDNNPGWIFYNTEGRIEYSRDTENWTVWFGDSVAAQEPSEDGSYYLFFRGQDNSIITGSVDAGWKLEGTAGIECHGNIMTLLDYKDPDSAEMGEYCFKYMFYGCTLLKTAPELPATKLTLSCYNGMFTDCSSLAAAPELPAEELVYHCYSCMFSKCSSLNISESRDMDPVSGGTEFFKCPAEAAEDAVEGMFFSTGGDFYDSKPVPGRTYYWY